MDQNWKRKHQQGDQMIRLSTLRRPNFMSRASKNFKPSRKIILFLFEVLKRYANGHGWNNFRQKVSAFICNYCTSSLYSCSWNSFSLFNSSQPRWKVNFSHIIWSISYLMYYIVHMIWSLISFISELDLLWLSILLSFSSLVSLTLKVSENIWSKC